MSHFAVAITDIPGEETLVNWQDQITCRSMKHGIDMPVVAKGADRTDGASMHGSIVLEHDIDAATPAIRLACAQTTNISDVTITRIKALGEDYQAADITKLKTVKIVDVYLDTPLDLENGTPADMPVEVFVLDYEEIKWEHKVYVNGVASDTIAGSYDTTAMSTTVSIA